MCVTDSSDYAEDDSGPGLYVSHWGTVNTGGFWGDMAVKGSSDEAWEKTDMGWSIVPWGLRKLLLWIQARYRWIHLSSPQVVRTADVWVRHKSTHSSTAECTMKAES